MFIKSLIDAVDRLIHNGKHYPVVNGIANVPQEVRDEMVSHVDWQDNTDEIDQETLSSLEEANQPKEQDEGTGAPDDDEDTGALDDSVQQQPETPEAPAEQEQPNQEVVLDKKESKKKTKSKAQSAAEVPDLEKK